MTDNLQFALDAVWRVLAVSLVIGAGLPVLFALGVRSLAWSGAGSPDGSTVQQTRPLGRVLAVACFAVVVAGVALGLAIIVATGQGAVVSFEHGHPTITEKPE